MKTNWVFMLFALWMMCIFCHSCIDAIFTDSFFFYPPPLSFHPLFFFRRLIWFQWCRHEIEEFKNEKLLQVKTNNNTLCVYILLTFFGYSSLKFVIKLGISIFLYFFFLGFSNSLCLQIYFKSKWLVKMIGEHWKWNIYTVFFQRLFMLLPFFSLGYASRKKKIWFNQNSNEKITYSAP